jgi:hypothetical protein
MGPTFASLCIAVASYGFALLWVVIFNAVFWAGVQYPATRMGISEERGIIPTLSTMSRAFLTGTYFMFDKMKWEVKGCREIAVVRFILFKDGLV